MQRQRGKVLRVSQNSRRPDGQTDRQTESADSIETFSLRREEDGDNPTIKADEN